MAYKEHLVGGTLRSVMVQEVLRAMKANKGHIDTAAVELGITPRTLRLWKANWPELQGIGGMNVVLKTKKKIKKSKPKPKSGKCY